MYLIYSTENGEVYQEDSENCYYLQYKGSKYRMNVCGFIAFKSKLDKFYIEEMLLSDASKNPIEIIPLCNNDRLMVLTIDEIIELKDLAQGSLVMLELNSIVCQRINRSLV